MGLSRLLHEIVLYHDIDIKVCSVASSSMKWDIEFRMEKVT